MGSDSASRYIDDITQVSIHAPVWGATSDVEKLVQKELFQSTLPYGERQQPAAVHYLLYVVSIHAPVWGATSEETFSELFGQVSIHAPVWGATFLTAFRSGEAGFQSTLPYGERQQSRTIFLPFSVIVYAIITILLY